MIEELKPSLRFPEFKNKKSRGYYKKYSFKDIFLFSTGKNIKQNEASPEFETPCVRYGELYHMYNEIIYDVINKTNIDKSELLFSKGNEILLPSAGEDPLDIGAASALTIKDVAIGRTINILSPKENNVYSQIYVSYYINQKLKKKISKLAQGSSISNIYNSDLKKLSLILPNLNEQKKIANFFTVIDKRIKLLQEKKEVLKDYKRSIMKKLFSSEIRFKQQDGSDFPNWIEQRLSDVFTFLRGSNLSKSDITDSGVNYCIHYGELFTLYSEVIDEVISKTNIQGVFSMKGDIIMPSSDVTPNGLATASALQQNKIVLGGDINILRPKSTSGNSLFFSYLLNYSKKDLIRLITGTTIKHIYNRDISQLKFKIPKSLEEQNKITSLLRKIDQKINLVNEQVDDLKNVKKSLLQKMFL